MGQIIAFGFGMLANQMFPAILGIFMIVLVEDLGFTGLMWSGVFLFPRIFDAITDPIMGFISDNTKSKYGRRKQYVVIGGMAMVLHGFNRGTEDIDLLVDKVASNISLLKKALSILPDNAIQDIRDSDVEKYEVVRVADEVVVDLMGSACGIDFKSAESQIEWHELEGVKIPFASAELMLKTKQTLREKDEIDRLYLRRILGKL